MARWQMLQSLLGIGFKDHDFSGLEVKYKKNCTCCIYLNIKEVFVQTDKVFYDKIALIT